MEKALAFSNFRKIPNPACDRNQSLKTTSGPNGSRQQSMA